MAVAGPAPPNGEAPRTLETRSTSPAASPPPALGLAGVGGGSSQVRSDGNTPPQKTAGPRGQPAITVRASDLHSAAEKPAGFDVLGGLDLPTEHPNVGATSNANHFSFWGKVHHKLTYQAAIDAGLNESQATKLADLVVGVDSLPHSQETGFSFMHGMRAEAEPLEDFFAVRRAYEAKLTAMHDADGLAGLLHLLQDSYSQSHVAPDGRPIEWHGMWSEVLSLNLWHVWLDRFPSEATQRSLVRQSADLIKQYIQACGGSIKGLPAAQPVAAK